MGVSAVHSNVQNSVLILFTTSFIHSPWQRYWAGLRQVEQKMHIDLQTFLTQTAREDMLQIKIYEKDYFHHLCILCLRHSGRGGG